MTPGRRKPDFKTLETGVLILGAGLAGLSAATAASRQTPSASLALAAPAPGPTGSSFSGPDALGMAAPETAQEKEEFVRMALEIAPPGRIDESLVRILADEAGDRFRDLVEIGAAFDADSRGGPMRRTLCFAPELKIANVIRSPDLIRRKCEKRLSAGNFNMLSGWEAVALISEPSRPPRVRGAILKNRAGGILAVKAARTIAAMGGPAPLFALNTAGAHVSGYSHALMAEAGVPLTNEGYMQFMWHSMPERKFFKISRIAEPGMKVISPRGEKLSLPEAAGNPAAQRSSHCPYAFGREDSFLDRFLFANLNGAGAVEVRGAGGERLLLSPLAHAANGGAAIDEDGRTGARGLLAAGECAAGMHGANRLGGAMVAAALVFGSRAGKTAALECGDDALPAKTFTSLTVDTLVQREIHAGPEPDPLPPISANLHGDAALEGSENLQEAADFLYERKTSAAGRKEKLALEGALLMVRFLLRNRSLSD